MKNKGLIITLISIISIFLVGFIVLFIMLMKNDFKFSDLFDYKSNNEVVIDTTYETIFNKININVEYGDINIYKSTDELIHLYVFGNKEKSEIKENEDLTINVKSDECHFICINQKKSKVDLYLPDAYNGNVKINTQYGDIKVESMENTNLNIISDYGDVKIDKVFNLNVEVDYGDIDVKQILNKVNIKSDYGDIKINELISNEDSKIEADYGDIKINKTNDLFIDVHTDLGKEKVNNNNRRAEHSLTIVNDCGDIIVN